MLDEFSIQQTYKLDGTRYRAHTYVSVLTYEQQTLYPNSRL